MTAKRMRVMSIHVAGGYMAHIAVAKIMKERAGVSSRPVGLLNMGGLLVYSGSDFGSGSALGTGGGRPAFWTTCPVSVI